MRLTVDLTATHCTCSRAAAWTHGFIEPTSDLQTPSKPSLFPGPVIRIPPLQLKANPEQSFLITELKGGLQRYHADIISSQEMLYNNFSPPAAPQDSTSVNLFPPEEALIEQFSARVSISMLVHVQLFLFFPLCVVHSGSCSLEFG
ncbi:hypothetical protein Q8A73_011229 [Channa argus]|nr:hypothetical protein Q8A73_011229 [Channa argus]